MKTKLELTIEGIPRSKKNSQQIIKVGGKPRLIQSKAYREYEKDAVAQIEAMHKAWHVDFPCNVKLPANPRQMRSDKPLGSHRRCAGQGRSYRG